MSKNSNAFDLEIVKKNRKKFSFKFSRFITRIITLKPKVKFLGEKFPDEPIMLLTNHVARKVPLKIELFYPREFVFWGTHEMTEGLKAVRIYLSTTYLHQKKHFPKWLSYPIGFILAPFLNALYSGLYLVPTYQDVRLLNTVKKSVGLYTSGRDIVIFPEDSSNGYLDEITRIYDGFIILLDLMLLKGKEMPLYLTYYNRKNNTFTVSERISYSQLKEKYPNKEEVLEEIRIRLNSLK